MEIIAASIASCLNPCLSPVCAALARQIGYLKAKTIIKQLAEAMEDLKAKRDDIRLEIEAADRDGQQPTRQVQRWREKVSEIEEEVQRWLDKISATMRDDIRLENEAAVREQRQRTQEVQRRPDCEGSGCNLFGARIPKCLSSYRTRRRASKLLAKVMALEEERRGLDNILTQQPPIGRQEINTDTSIQGGTVMASYLENARCHLKEEEGYLIGIWGMGGVGKTTLLEAINNDVDLHQSTATEDTKLFDHVIFVRVSKDHRVEKLQEDIREKLSLRSNGNVGLQADIIFNFLKEKNFLLLLDDVWEAVDLRAIGIPNRARASNKTDRQQKHKVVITTRSEQVCGEMNSYKKIRVECLKEDEAWNLFKEKVGNDLFDSHPDLVSPTQEVAKECGGLPLALIVIGRAMSTKRTSEAWNYALTQLRKSQVSNIPGMEDSMFPTLKFSYDNLHDDKMRNCFLCCSLWPEDYKFDKEELILVWMGLGLIDDFDNINEAHDLGHSIIESLIAASLLEPVVRNVDRRVKMHDVIRDLALWIACDCGKERNRWLVKANANLRQVPSDITTAKWGEAKRISLMSNNIEELPRNLPAGHCPNLSVLLLQRNGLKEIPIGFLEGMPNLTYLDLSRNYSLREIPNEIGCLVKLRYLNLSFTSISSLPDELGQLPNLKYLLLGDTMRGPVSIPKKVLSSLSKKLEFLDLFPQGELRSYDDDDDDELTLIISLLSGLKAVGVKIKSFKILQQLSRHQVPITRLCMEDMGDADSPSSFHLLHQFNSVTRGCLRELDLDRCHSLSEVVMDNNLPRLERLVFYDLKKMREIVWRRNVVPSECFRRLRYLSFTRCPLLRNITWILHLPLLEHLGVSNCEAMEQLIVDGATASSAGEEAPRITFPCLKYLFLSKLPRLCDICSSSDYALLNFPSLVIVEVFDCPELKKLPFRPQVNCRKLRHIQGSAIWWDSIEWEDEDIKSSFESLGLPKRSI